MASSVFLCHLARRHLASTGDEAFHQHSVALWPWRDLVFGPLGAHPGFAAGGGLCIFTRLVPLSEAVVQGRRRPFLPEPVEGDGGATRGGEVPRPSGVGSRARGAAGPWAPLPPLSLLFTCPPCWRCPPAVPAEAQGGVTQPARGPAAFGWHGRSCHCVSCFCFRFHQ